MTSSWNVNVFDSFVSILLRLTTGGLRYLFAFMSAFVISLLLTPMVREFARRSGMVDQPDARRINMVPIPRGGGLAVFFAFHFVLFIFSLIGGGEISRSFDGDWQWNFFAASSLLLAVGFIDDKYGMKPVIKLVGQIAVATILFSAGIRLGGIIVAFPVYLDYIVTLFWIVGAINAFNLIDGMDGLSTGLSLIASVGIAGALVFNGHAADTVPYLILAGACLGFLRYNFHPASVFLGDSGSMFLGLCVATLPLVTGSRRELVASLGVPLLAMGIPIFDTMLAIWRRTARAMLPKDFIGAHAQTNVMQPDQDHVHHRILRKTLNQRTAAVTLYLASAALVLVGLAGMLLRNHAPGFFMITFMVAAVVAVRHMVSVELWDTGRMLSKKRATLRQAIVLPAYITIDILSLIFAWITARFFSGLPLGRSAFLYNMPVVIAIIFIALVASRTYRRVWSRAHTRDYVILTFTLFFATLFATGVILLLAGGHYGMVRFAVLMFMCSFFPVVGLRVARECLGSIVHLMEKLVIHDRSDTERIIVYGGGVSFRLYLKEMISKTGKNTILIVGLIDDDIHLKGRMISGYMVLGGGDDMLALAKEYRATRVLITCDMPDDDMEQMVKEFDGSGIKLSVWRCFEEVLN